ncbi:helix-turn-helix domain-containing protein [Sphingosinicella sp. YJ22]|uniref:helix-turn-helix domain-containing protein n=1 Tax=Sphingosinicella sp. YJ22 TaxID=1104780 RepID=UPI00140D5735
MNTSVDLNDLLDNEQTAALLGIKPNTLEIWRTKGRGPAFLKLGDAPQAPVRYLRSEVMGWLAGRSFPSTSAYTAAVRSPARPMVSQPGRASA